MYELLHEILKDQKTDVVFKCFGIYHIIYMILTFIAIAFMVFILKNKAKDTKQKVITTLINIAFGLYILDFFLMPIAYKEIDIEKLPFHICTLSCVMCFLTRHTKRFSKFAHQFAVLGLIGNLIYVIYPAGVGWYMIHPLSYRVIQTLLFHAVMTSYGVVTLCFDEVSLEYKKSYKELIIIVIMTLWAILGNFIYNGKIEGYNHFFNWFFVIQDPFYILPSEISKFIMPIVMIIVIYFAVMIVYLVFNVIKKIKK